MMLIRRLSRSRTRVSQSRAHMRRGWSSSVLMVLGLVCVGPVACKKSDAESDSNSRAGSVEDDARYPESATGFRQVEAVRSKSFMVAAAHPQATRIGYEVLHSGGSAVDAAVAVQMALTLVEPQSSGIGGGAFLLHYHKADARLQVYDGRETAPATVDERLFMLGPSEKMGFLRAVIGGRAVGVPGVVGMLELAHAEHGRKPWSELFEAPIELAQRGFAVTPRLHHLLQRDPFLATMPRARAHFFDAEGEPRPVGFVLRNPALARTFQTLAKGGAAAFYNGPLAQSMVDAVAQARQLPAESLTFGHARKSPAELGMASQPAAGQLSRADLASYRALEREPLCIDYRKFRVCGPPLPSGTVGVLQILGILEHFKLDGMPARSVAAMHLLAEAQVLVYADRERWFADPDVVDLPQAGLVSKAYLRERAQLVNPRRAAKEPRAGSPSRSDRALEPAKSPEQPSTSHFSIVDAQGNVVSMTSSIETAFGAHVLVEGFLLNNQLTDFSFRPTEGDRKVANAVGPRKRPRSSMSPIIIFDRETNAPLYALGSPGGSRIISYVAQAAVAMMDWGLSPNDALALPHVIRRGATLELEDSGWSSQRQRSAVVAGLGKLGHTVKVRELNSGLHVVAIESDTMLAGIDPRREGTAQ